MRTAIIVTVVVAASGALGASGASDPSVGIRAPTETRTIGASIASDAAPPAEPVYAPPVDGEVTDPFRPPATPYGPGNRGLEYATRSGGPARSIGGGAVTFAGPVAGRGVVVVEHPDGLRSSLTGLATISVRVGETVVRGQEVGTTAAALHLGVRRGDQYLDPALLFGGGGPPRHAVLVPVP